jgi:hypothetical protein
MGAALSALILAMLVLGPTVDSFICQGEAGVTPASTENVGDVAIQHSNDHGSGKVLDGLDVCIHGHCHHGAPYVPTNPVVARGPIAELTQHALHRVQVATSDPHFGLIRPPRA